MRETMTSRRYTNLVGRVLAKVPCGIASPDDLDAVSGHPEARKPHHWFTAWMERAGAAQETARTAVQGGCPGAAAASYLRASEYYRAAASAYWPDRSDAAVADAMRLHVECFQAALDLDGPENVPFSIRAGDGVVTGYLFQPRHVIHPDMAVLCCGPSDGTAEEQYALLGIAAIQQGCRVLLANPRELHAVSTDEAVTRQALDGLRKWFAGATQVQDGKLSLVAMGEGQELARRIARFDRSTTVCRSLDGPPEAENARRSGSEAAEIARCVAALRAPAINLERWCAGGRTCLRAHSTHSALS